MYNKTALILVEVWVGNNMIQTTEKVVSGWYHYSISDEVGYYCTLISTKFCFVHNPYQETILTTPETVAVQTVDLVSYNRVISVNRKTSPMNDQKPLKMGPYQNAPTRPKGN